MLQLDPKERPSWKELMVNDWFKRMTSKEEEVLVCPDYIDSSNCFEPQENTIEESAEDAGKKEDYHEQEMQSIIEEEEKFVKRMNSDSSNKSVNLEKRSSVKILDSFEISRLNTQSSNNQLKKYAITKSMLNRLKESKGALKDATTISKPPFDFNTFLKSNINSFYKKTVFMNSFHREDSGSLSHEDSGRQKQSSNIKNDYSREQSIKYEQNKEEAKTQNSESSKNFVIQSSLNENIPTAQINEFFRDVQCLSQKIKVLNERTPKFLPSMQSRETCKISQQ